MGCWNVGSRVEVGYVVLRRGSRIVEAAVERYTEVLPGTISSGEGKLDFVERLSL